MGLFFTRRLNEVETETIPRANPASAELEAVEEAYQQAAREFSKAVREVFLYQQTHRERDAIMFVNDLAFYQVNGSSLNPRLQELCYRREQARAKHSELLNLRADLLRRAGRIR